MRQIWITVSGLVLASLAACVSGKELPVARPEDEGMSSERLSRVTDVAQRYVDSGLFPGAITVVARNGKIVHFSAIGRRGIHDKRPMPLDGIFRLYSSTKAVTSVAMMQLYEAGHFQLSDPVAKFVPELASLEVLQDGTRTPAQSQMTIRQLLTHTSGLSYGINPDDPVDRAYLNAKLWHSRDLDDFIERVSRLPLRSQPGTAWNYSVGLDVAGLIVQRVSGKRFDSYLEEHLFGPLDMQDTGFVVSDDKLDRLIPNHMIGSADVPTQPIEPLKPGAERNFPGGIFAYGCRALCNFQDVSFFSGGAGLVSTARDYMRFAEMLRNGGQLDGIRILSPVTVEFMTSPHVATELWSAGPGQSFGLGVSVLTDPRRAGIVGSAGEFFHDGAGGTVFWVDPAQEIVALGMIQVMGGFFWRPELKVAVYQAVTDLSRYQKR